MLPNASADREELSSRCRTYDIVDMVDRVRYTSIFCYALCRESRSFSVTFSRRSVTSDCIVDVWLRLFVQVDYFCVASAFEVKYSVVIPSVSTVITDQETLGSVSELSYLFLTRSQRGLCSAIHMSVAEQCIEAIPLEWQNRLTPS